MCQIERGFQLNFTADRVIVAAHRDHEYEQRGDQQDGDPGAGYEFCSQHDNDGDGRSDGAEAIQKHALPRS